MRVVRIEVDMHLWGADIFLFAVVCAIQNSVQVWLVKLAFNYKCIDWLIPSQRRRF